MNFSDDFFKEMEPLMQSAYNSMEELEAGAIANPDEGRMVGHYWLRNPTLAPEVELTAEIEKCLRQIKKISSDIHNGVITGSKGTFKNCLIIGIGGSALGPQFVADALSRPKSDRMKLYFFSIILTQME
jgi:glucose-6-phosphate isomerase